MLAKFLSTTLIALTRIILDQQMQTSSRYLRKIFASSDSSNILRRNSAIRLQIPSGNTSLRQASLSTHSRLQEISSIRVKIFTFPAKSQEEGARQKSRCYPRLDRDWLAKPRESKSRTESDEKQSNDPLDIISLIFFLFFFFFVSFSDRSIRGKQRETRIWDSRWNDKSATKMKRGN